MDGCDALGVLGLEPGTDFAAIRARYRERIRTVHPDVVGATADAVAATASLNEAFAVLARAAADGALPAVAEPAVVESTADERLVLLAPRGDVFERLYDAIDAIGSVTYADPEAGIIEGLLTTGGSQPCQLVVALESGGHVTEAYFTLDPLGHEAAPPIDGVVRRIARHVNGPR